MDSTVAAGLIAGLSALLGSVVGGVVGHYSNLRAIEGAERQATEQRKHERELAAAQHLAQLKATEDAYQADTMADAQLALQRLASATSVINKEDLRRYREGGSVGRIGRSQVKGWSTEHLSATTALLILRERIRDEGVRSAITTAQEAMFLVITLADTEESRMARWVEAMEAHQDAINVLGEALRGLPAPLGPYRPVVDSHVWWGQRELDDEPANHH